MNRILTTIAELAVAVCLGHPALSEETLKKATAGIS